MIQLRRLLVAGILLVALATPALAAPEATPSSEQPPNCPKGYVCLLVEELAESTAVVWELRADLARSKAKQRRLGGVLGCGLGLSGVVVESPIDGMRFETAPAVHCGLTYGFRF